MTSMIASLTIKTDTPSFIHQDLTMNIYSALRSHNGRRLVRRIRKYINDDGFAGIVESIDVSCSESIREGCRALNAYMDAPFLRPRIMAWLRSY